MRLILGCVLLCMMIVQVVDVTSAPPPSTKDLKIPKENFGVQGSGFSTSGYSELELNNKTFQENVIDASLWRAVSE